MSEHDPHQAAHQPGDQEQIDALKTDETFGRALLDCVAGRWTDADLSDEDRALLEAVSGWLPALPLVLADHPSTEESRSAAPPPVRGDDPVAQLLGLVPDRSVTLDGRRLAAVRKSAGLDLAQLVERLQTRGWAVTVSMALHWERNRVNPPPATIDAIAHILDVAPHTLLNDRPADHHSIDELFSDARIAAFLQDWADELDISADVVAARSKRLFATAGKRHATTATPDTVLAVLRHLRTMPGIKWVP